MRAYNDCLKPIRTFTPTTRIAMNSFVLRLLSGAVYVALIVLVLLISTPWGLWALLSFFAVAGIIEFNRLTGVNRAYLFRVALDAAAAVWLLYATVQSALCMYGGTQIYTPYLLYVLYLFCRSAFLPQRDMLRSLGNSILSQLYIAAPLSMAIGLTQAPGCSPAGYDGLFLLSLFILIWANDTGAYLVGDRFGKRPLAPGISPHKTIEGAIGGLVAALLAALFVLPPLTGQTDWLRLLLIGATVTIFGTVGDLFESALKRMAGVKDSGRLIPGHGGVLDRIDSMLLAVPAIFLLLQFF